MSKKGQGIPIRPLSILVGVIVGFILSYAYQVHLPTLFYEIDGYSIVGLLYSLVVFVAVPLLAGFAVGLLYTDMVIRNGLYVGLIVGVFNSVIASVKLIFAPDLVLREIYAFSLFAIVSVFVWMVLAAVAAELASRFYE